MPGSLPDGAGSASGQLPDSPPSKRVRRQGEEGSPEQSEVAGAASAGTAVSGGAGKRDGGTLQMERCVSSDAGWIFSVRWATNSGRSYFSLVEQVDVV